MNSNEIHNICPLATFTKSYSRKAVWGCYTVIHFKTFYKNIKKILLHKYIT